MITLITGLPGNGKTLYALSWLKDKAAKENRTVYYSGIADLRIPGWVEGDPEKWMELPKGSIIVVDEVQRIMRPRQHGTKVPDFVAALETHRHLGVDLVLITQHPMLLDSNVRRLVGQHFHVVRKFGTAAATIHEWGAAKETCDKNRDNSIEHHWIYPKEVYSLYKSAEVHTKHGRIPMKVWVFLALPFILGAIVWFLYHRIMSKTVAPVPAAGGEYAARASGGSPGVKLTKTEYIAQFQPRVPGLAYTSPAYDEVTKPVIAPYPAACVHRATTTIQPSGLSGAPIPERCQCYTQQGTRLEVPRDLCLSIAAGGFFVAWQQPPAAPVQTPREAPSLPRGESPAPLVGFGYSQTGSTPTRSVLETSRTEDLPPGRGGALPRPSPKQN